MLSETCFAFDSIRKFHIGQETESECVKKAYFYLKCSILSALALKIGCYISDFERLKDKLEIAIVSNKDFLKELHLNELQITTKLKEVDLDTLLELVSKTKQNTLTKSILLDVEKCLNPAIENLMIVSNLIDDFYTSFYTSEKILWTTSIIKERYTYKFFKFSVKYFIMGLITSSIAALLISHFIKNPV